MRIKSSLYNSLSNVLILVSTTIMTFVARTVFIQILGKECIGLDGLFTNILTVLSVAELGIGTAINFSLYKPIQEKDTKKISKIMSFYKKIYKCIGIIILIIGFIIMLFLNLIVKDYTIDNLYLIYFLYLLNTVITYFISYKDALLYANQKYYELSKLRTIFIFLLYGFQCVFLYITKSYVMYLLILLICKFVERILINIYITKKYGEIDFNCDEKLEKEEVEKIKTNVKGMFFHKIGNYFLNSTDNILISALVNIATVGVYSNYLALVSVARNFITTFLSGVTSSFGNLIASSDNDSQERVFRILDFLSFIICGFVTVCFINLLTPFIQLWLGKEYVVDNMTMIMICLNFYCYCMLIPINIVKDASGQYYIDRYIPIIQVIVNLIASVILSQKFGLLGIILGTFISYILVILWSKPLIVYKYIFKKSVKKYYISQIKKIIIISITSLIIIFIFNNIKFKLNIFNLIVKGLLCFIIYGIMILVVYYRSNELKNLINIIKDLFKDVKNEK